MKTYAETHPGDSYPTTERICNHYGFDKWSLDTKLRDFFEEREHMEDVEKHLSKLLSILQQKRALNGEELFAIRDGILRLLSDSEVFEWNFPA